MSESLEERRLLAVTYDGNMETFSGQAFPGTPITETITVPYGNNAALFVAIGTDDLGPTGFEYGTLNVKVNGVYVDNTGTPTIGNVPASITRDVSTSTAVDADPDGNVDTDLTNAIYVIPLYGTDNMSRVVQIEFTHTASSDIVGTVASFHGVDQASPEGAIAVKNLAIPSASDTLSTPAVVVGNEIVDSIFMVDDPNVPGIIQIAADNSASHRSSIRDFQRYGLNASDPRCDPVGFPRRNFA